MTAETIGAETITTALVAPLDSFGRDDIATAGGKGANLGELVRAGFQVPPGFVITTRAYDLVVTLPAFAERVAALATVNPADATALAEAAGALHAAFEAATIPAGLASEIAEALHHLGPDPVAVRSSATAEDLPGATFAGQQETFLNVIGDEAVLDAVRRCWASLWSERAVAYRQRQDVDHGAVKLAVVVQRLIPADVAGVAFTANPLTGARDELVIDASPGLGEAVVSGAVTPDHYVVKKGTHAIISQAVGRREVVIRPTAGGGTETLRTAGAAAVTDPALDAAQIHALAEMAESVERHFGAPQDIEWALAQSQLYVLQSRPVTALPPEPALATHLPASPPARKKRRRSRRPDLAGELFPIRPYPLDATAHMRVLMKALGDTMTGPLGLSFPTAERWIETEDGLPVRLKKGLSLGPSWRLIYKPWLSLWQRRHIDLSRWQDDPVIPEAIRRARELEQRDFKALSWDELIATFREALDLLPFVLTLRERYLILAVKDLLLLALLLAVTGQARHFSTLTSGADNKTLALNRALEDLATLVRESPALLRVFAENAAAEIPDALAHLAGSPAAAGDVATQASHFLDAFDRLLDEYGHRESFILYISQPAWKDDPTIPLGIVKSLALAPLAPEPAGPAPWERARDSVLAHSILGFGPLRRLFLRRLPRARLMSTLREDSHFYVVRAITPERRTALELGRRLVTVGVLDDPEEVFLLCWDELQALGRPWPPPDAIIRRLRALAKDRQTRRAALADVPFVERDALDAADLVEGALLSGQPGSVGVAEGPVRIILSPADFGKLQPGDVLVAPFTNPSWTPLFTRARAVIVDTGAAMSHAAIVAREYGVPAVMGTGHATTILKDGQWVRVDGGRGLVFAASSTPLAAAVSSVI
jgi:rifampicin phosphotransferase